MMQDVGLYMKLNPGLPWQKQLSTRKGFFSFTSKYVLNLRKKLRNCYVWSVALCGTETYTLRKVGQKYPESLEM